MSAWSDGASADGGCVGRAWFGRLEPVSSSIAGCAVVVNSVLDACGGGPGVALSCDWCALVEDGQSSGGICGRHRGRAPSCSVVCDVGAGLRSGEGGVGGVSIREVGGRCCWHGEQGGSLDGKDGSEGLGSGRVVAVLGEVCVLMVWFPSPNSETGDLSHRTMVLTAALSSDDKGDAVEKRGWREGGEERWQESSLSVKFDLWQGPW